MIYVIYPHKLKWSSKFNDPINTVAYTNAIEYVDHVQEQVNDTVPNIPVPINSQPLSQPVTQQENIFYVRNTEYSVRASQQNK